jgi:hypothetical protein
VAVKGLDQSNIPPMVPLKGVRKISLSGNHTPRTVFFLCQKCASGRRFIPLTLDGRLTAARPSWMPVAGRIKATGLAVLPAPLIQSLGGVASEIGANSSRR